MLALAAPCTWQRHTQRPTRVSHGKRAHGKAAQAPHAAATRRGAEPFLHPKAILSPIHPRRSSAIRPPPLAEAHSREREGMQSWPRAAGRSRRVLGMFASRHERHTRPDSTPHVHHHDSTPPPAAASMPEDARAESTRAVIHHHDAPRKGRARACPTSAHRAARMRHVHRLGTASSRVWQRGSRSSNAPVLSRGMER